MTLALASITNKRSHRSIPFVKTCTPRCTRESGDHTQLANMSFDKIRDLEADAHFLFCTKAANMPLSLLLHPSWKLVVFSENRKQVHPGFRNGHVSYDG